MFQQLSVLSLVALAAGFQLDPLANRRVSSSPRIVGGNPTKQGAWPWQVSLQQNYIFLWLHICGGTLVAPNYVITAAHCVENFSPSQLRIVAGEHSMKSKEGSEQNIKVKEIIMHPGYDGNANGFPNDIALLKLSSNADLSSQFVNTISMADDDDGDFANQRCFITGWGKISGESSTSDVLQEAEMTVIDNDQCSTHWTSVAGAAIFNSHICIYEEGKSACSGDSGGPMVCRHKSTNEYVLTGVTSWGISKCDAYPSVYTRVSSFTKWLIQMMN